MADEKNIDALIGDLAAELKPLKGGLHPVILISPWVVIAVAYMAGVIHFLGLRMDWPQKLQEAPFLFEMLLSALVAVSSAYTAGWLAIPDMRQQQWVLAVPSALFGVFMLWVGCQIAAEGFRMPKVSWHHCFSDALLMGFVPVATLSLLVRRGATTRPGWMAFMCILSVGALGWIALRLTCGGDDTGHTLLFHFLPFVLAASVLGALARRLYRW